MAKKKPARNRVRIIAGTLGGRRITFSDSPGLRPTGDRLRETLFSWLQPYIVNSAVLDMFAGSGVLGFEAASRGAAQVTMVEKSSRVCGALRSSAGDLGLHNVAVHCQSSLADLPGAAGGYDIVFVDPPFDEALHTEAVAILANGVLAKTAHVVIENDRHGTPVCVPGHWHLQREKIAGDVHLQLFSVQGILPNAE